MEWFHIAHNNNTCPEYEQWLQLFYQGGYRPIIAGSKEHYQVWYQPTYVSEVWEPLAMSIHSALNVVWVHSSVYHLWW